MSKKGAHKTGRRALIERLKKQGLKLPHGYKVERRKRKKVRKGR